MFDSVAERLLWVHSPNDRSSPFRDHRVRTRASWSSTVAVRPRPAGKPHKMQPFGRHFSGRAAIGESLPRDYSWDSPRSDRSVCAKRHWYLGCGSRRKGATALTRRESCKTYMKGRSAGTRHVQSHRMALRIGRVSRGGVADCGNGGGVSESYRHSWWIDRRGAQGRSRCPVIWLIARRATFDW